MCFYLCECFQQFGFALQIQDFMPFLIVIEKIKQVWSKKSDYITLLLHIIMKTNNPKPPALISWKTSCARWQNNQTNKYQIWEA